MIVQKLNSEITCIGKETQRKEIQQNISFDKLRVVEYGVGFIFVFIFFIFEILDDENVLFSN